MLFLVSSLLLVLLVIWWGIFFLNRVEDLKAGESARLHVTALQWLSQEPHSTAPPAGLLLVPVTDPQTAAALFIQPAGQGQVLIPAPEAQQAIEQSYARKRLMILSEGALLLLLVLVSLGAIAASQAKAFRINWEMSNFLQAVTHELKSPLTSLKLLLETLKDQPAALPEPGPALEAGLGEIARLERGISNVLQISALEGRRLRLKLEAIELGRALRIWAQEREALVRLRQGTLTLVTPEPVVVRYDPTALATILDNLLDNALKYSQGAAEITITLAQDEIHATLAMRDAGIGLQAGDAERVFDRFWRAGDELTRNAPGSGLGLYLVRKLIAYGGGQVRAESPGPGQGTTITCTWPRGSYDDLVPTRDLIPAG